MKVAQAVALTFFLLVIGCALPPGPEALPGVSRQELRAVTLSREGLSFLDSGRFMDAELSIRHALLLSPGTKSLRLSLSVALIGLEQFEEARGIIAEYLVKEPDSHDLIGRMAALKFAEGDYKGAILQFKEALKVAFNNKDQAYAAGVAKTISQLALARGMSEEAICYARLVQTLKMDNDSTLKVAELLVNEGYFTQALNELQALRDGKEMVPQAYYLSGLASFGLADYAKALEYSYMALRGGRLEFEDERNSEILQLAALSKLKVDEKQMDLIKSLTAKYEDQDMRSGFVLQQQPMDYIETVNQIFAAPRG